MKKALAPNKCPNCGIEYTPKRNPAQKYCSVPCAQDGLAAIRGRRATGAHPPSAPFQRGEETLCALPLSPNGYSLIDAADADLVRSRVWFRCPNGYANGTGPGDTRPVYLHRLLAGVPPGLEADHINGDRLDNRRCNLRVVTPGQNQANRTRAPRNSSTGVLNVCKASSGKPYIVQFRIARRNYRFGRFDTLQEAAELAARIRAQRLASIEEAAR